MPKQDFLSMSVSDWEAFFTNRSNTQAQDKFGASPFDYFAEAFRSPHFIASQKKRIVYPKMVQAILNRWIELDTVVRDGWENRPITAVASMAFISSEVRSVIDESLRDSYERLWNESPRPHSKTHLIIALESRGALPVSRTELGLLYELDGWGFMAARVAGQKGWTDLAIQLFDQLYEDNRANDYGMNVHNIHKAVEICLPKIKGLRLILKFFGDTKYGQRFIQRWEKELLAEGMTKEEIYS